MKSNYILIAIISVFLLLVFVQFGKPYHGDEVVFPECAKGIVNQGVPIINYGILNPNYQCLWHAPSFMYLLALSSLIFGDNAFSYRIVSVLFIILSAILVNFSIKKLFPDDKNKELYALFGMVLYLFNPLTVQSALVTDIDGGMLTFFTLLSFYLFISKSNWILFSISLVLLFLTKVSGPIVLFASLILFLIYKKDIKGIFKIILFFILSAIIFILIFGYYTDIFNLNFSMPFIHNFVNGGGLFSNHFNLIALSKMAWVFKSFFYFTIPFFFLLFLIVPFSLLYKIIKNKKLLSENYDIIILSSIISLFTIILFVWTGAGGFGFPKYFAPAIPFMVIAISGIIFPYIDKNFKYALWFISKNKWRLIILVITLSLYFIFVVGDPLMPEFDSTAKNADMVLAIKLIAKSFSFYIILPAIATFFILKGNKKLIFGLIFLILFFYLYLNILQASVQYSTSFRYGDTGIEETLQFFKENNVSSNHIVTYPNLGYYLGMSNYYEIMMLYLDSSIFKEKVINNSEIQYMVIYERDLDRIGEEGMSYFELEKQIGSHFIFRKI